MKPLSQLVRPNIQALQPYSTARDEYAGGECAGSAVQTWLDANENPFENGINRYPDPHQRRLKRQIAALKGSGNEMDAITACVVGGVSMTGGVGKPWGVVIGCLLITVIANGLDIMGVSSHWQKIVKGAIIVLAVLIDVKGKSKKR